MENACACADYVIMSRSSSQRTPFTHCYKYKRFNIIVSCRWKLGRKSLLWKKNLLLVVLYIQCRSRTVGLRGNVTVDKIQTVLTLLITQDFSCVLGIEPAPLMSSDPAPCRCHCQVIELLKYKMIFNLNVFFSTFLT